MLPHSDRIVASSIIREYAGGSVGGILRKTGGINNFNSAIKHNNSNALYGGNAINGNETRQIDLLVFGYACKVFREDEKAREVDQGKHLIPWMGDPNLKIDRYDVRGALCDLTPYEAPPGGYGNRLDYLSSEEQRAEQLCEEERYLFLYNNEEEHILRQEEDLKRLRQESEGGNYSQVGFQYGGGHDNNYTTGMLEQGPVYLTEADAAANDMTEEVEQPFVPPQNFEIPVHIQSPETMKQHAIIEKTARFIASQGAQMEILLKAKQSNNVQFEFLTQKSVLNPYYKHLVDAIRQGTYPEESAAADEVSNNDNDIDGEAATANVDEVADTGGFVGFSGFGDVSKKSIITVPTIKYKPSANCAYTQLISKIRGVPLQTVIDEDANSNLSMVDLNSPTPSVQSSNGSEFTPVLLQYNGSTFAHATPTTTTPTNVEESNDDSKSANGGESSKVEILKNTSALALAQNYCSDTGESESEEEQDPEQLLAATIAMQKAELKELESKFPIPEENLRTIIDKTATYVIKNGRQFEETLRSKSVERFVFLLPDNEYYPYYLYKVTGDPDAASKEQKTRKAAAVAAALLSKKGLVPGAARTEDNKHMTPVSFSIKAKDEPTHLQPALPQEATDDEDNDEADSAGAQKQHDIKVSVNALLSNERQVPERVQRAIKLVESQLLARNGTTSTVSGTVYGPAPAAEIHSQPNTRQKELKKKAEDKVKDKLAQIAREKLGGLLTKEKQLQLERKRKALAFLNQIKGDNGSATIADSPNITDAAVAGDMDVKNVAPETVNAAIAAVDRSKSDDSDTSSVRSIPITSYGPEDDDLDLDQEENKVYDDSNRDDKVQLTVRNKAVDIEVATHHKPVKVGKMQKTQTVLLSDDDDVQVISEIRPKETSTPPLPLLTTSRHKSYTEKPKKKHTRETERTRDTRNTREYERENERVQKRGQRYERSQSHSKRGSASRSHKRNIELEQEEYERRRRLHKKQRRHEKDELSERQHEKQRRQQRRERHQRRRSSSFATASSENDTYDSSASTTTSATSSTTSSDSEASNEANSRRPLKTTESSKSSSRKLHKNDHHHQRQRNQAERQRSHKAKKTKHSKKSKTKSKKHSRSRSRSRSHSTKTQRKRHATASSIVNYDASSNEDDDDDDENDDKVSDTDILQQRRHRHRHATKKQRRERSLSRTRSKLPNSRGIEARTRH